MATGAPLMVIYKKLFDVMLVGTKYIFRGKNFVFCHMFKTNFSEHNKIWGAQKRFGSNCPRMSLVSADLGKTVARKSFITGLRGCAGGLDILNIYTVFNSPHEQHLQIVQMKYTYFPSNTHNRLVVSNQKFLNKLNKRNWVAKALSFTAIIWRCRNEMQM